MWIESLSLPFFGGPVGVAIGVGMGLRGAAPSLGIVNLLRSEAVYEAGSQLRGRLSARFLWEVLRPELDSVLWVVSDLNAWLLLMILLVEGGEDLGNKSFQIVS